MHLSGLFLYPVKSLGGIAVSSATLDALGLVGDRRFLVIDETGRFLTQRALPKMALVATALSATHLTLSAAGQSPVHIPLASDPAAPLRTVSVWKAEGLQAEDCGNEPAAWFSAFLGQRVRLVRAGAAFRRPVNKPGKSGPDDLVTFADAYSLLVISEASLHDLNDRLVADGSEALPMDRFRPNLVISGATPYAEDTWTRFELGTAVFRAGGPCARCAITTTNQQTAERGKEPLRTLAKYRRDATDPSDVNFGQNLFHETKTGSVHVGDRLELL